jgi:hypothetical protein
MTGMADTRPDSTGDGGTRFAVPESRDCGSDEQEADHSSLLDHACTYQAPQSPRSEI